MNHPNDFRDPALVRQLVEKIKEANHLKANFMEVCGTHTVAISRYGIRHLLPETVRLISGPGCPVCVTAHHDVDKAIAIAHEPGVIMTTFGDMMKVPGSYTSLAKEKADGVDVRVVYSTLDALKVAADNPSKEVVFFGVGFETTTPTIAASILEARRQGLRNYSVFGRHKLVPPAMAAILSMGEVQIDGFICPGHVSAIIGSQPYELIAEQGGVPCVVIGFEPVDILQGVYMLVKQVEEGEAKVEIEYSRIVRPEGNPKARAIMDEVFEVADADWRGIGVIPGSGLAIRAELSDFDAEKRFSVEVPLAREPKGCACGEILRGVKYPYECKLFGKACTPEKPIGPCMVSTEGACAAYYRYETTPVNV